MKTNTEIIEASLKMIVDISERDVLDPLFKTAVCVGIGELAKRVKTLDALTTENAALKARLEGAAASACELGIQLHDYIVENWEQDETELQADRPLVEVFDFLSSLGILQEAPKPIPADDPQPVTADMLVPGARVRFNQGDSLGTVEDVSGPLMRVIVRWDGGYSPSRLSTEFSDALVSIPPQENHGK